MVPELTMDGVQFQIDRGGVLKATGEAARLTYRRDTTDVAATDLAIDLLAAAGPVRLTAPTGSGRLAGQTFRVTGGLRATRGADVATTPSATYPAGPDGAIRIDGATSRSRWPVPATG